MSLSLGGAVAAKRRELVKKEFWPDDVPWEGAEEVGFFCAPRSLPLILQALSGKAVGGDKDPRKVYLELLARHMGQGVVEMTHDVDHAYASGYTSVRAWRDRMKILEDAGFIKGVSGGNRPYAKVFLRHPSVAMRALHEAGKVPKDLWEAYRSRQIEAKEPAAEEVLKRPRKG